MKKTLLVTAAVLASAFVAAPAWAQTAEPVDCAAAVVALNNADAAHRAAVDADKKLADAEADDEAVEVAQEERDEAASDLASQFRTPDAARAERARVQAELDKDTVVGDERAALERQLARLNRYIEAENDLADAKREADKTSVPDLRREADKTDANATQRALDETRRDFDRLCGGVTTTPPTPTTEPLPVDLDCKDLTDAEAQKVLDADLSDPHNLDSDGDGLACEEVDEVVTPSGGVATGGGPA